MSKYYSYEHYKRELSKVRSQQLQVNAKSFATSIESLNTVRNHKFDYVDSLFPHVKVKEVSLYKAESYVMKKCGYGGVGGFFDRINKVVIINDNLEFDPPKKNRFSVHAILSIDEVIVHELIHYCSDHKSIMAGKNIEEEIAYGNSVAYLRKNGRTDEFIINNHMMPYLMTAIDRNKVFAKVLMAEGYDIDEYRVSSQKKQSSIVKKLEDKIFAENKKEARSLGQRIIDIYTKKEATEVNNDLFISKRKIQLD